MIAFRVLEGEPYIPRTEIISGRRRWDVPAEVSEECWEEFEEEAVKGSVVGNI